MAKQAGPEKRPRNPGDLPDPLVPEMSQIRRAWSDTSRRIESHTLDRSSLLLDLAGEYAKDRREAVSSLPSDLTDNLTRLTDGRPLEAQLFADWEHNHAADQITADLKRVGIEKRTFGGKADFHSLRTTHVNLGVQLGFDWAKPSELRNRSESVKPK